MKAIMAMSENRCIGKENKIPWYVPNDFKWFKEFTMGKKLIVGKTTFNTLPFLKNRECLVLTRRVDHIDAYITNQYLVNNNVMTGQMITMEDLESYSQFRKDSMVVVGGAKTYVKLLPYITEFYVTHINGNYEGDVFMSEFESLFAHQEVVKEFDGHKVIVYTK